MEGDLIPNFSGREISWIFPGKIRFPGNGIWEQPSGSIQMHLTFAIPKHYYHIFNQLFTLFHRYINIFRFLNYFVIKDNRHLASLRELLFFKYPPSSGIAPCVGTAGRVHDTYT